MKKLFYILSLLFLTQGIFAQAKYLLPNEVAVFSFTTISGKKVMLAKDKDNKYIVYRFGSTKSVELEYPEKNKDSWNKFHYTYYMRGGGKANEGMELDDLHFVNKGYEYIIYNNYSAGSATEKESKTVGIAIVKSTDKNYDKAVIVKGKPETVKGGWYDLREAGLIKNGEEKYGLY